MKHGRVSDSNYSQAGPAGRWFESTPSDYHGRVAQLVEQECEKGVMSVAHAANLSAMVLKTPCRWFESIPFHSALVWEPYL